MTTPDFPLWSGGFAARVQALRTTLGPCLHQFEQLFAAWIPAGSLAQQGPSRAKAPIPATASGTSA